MRTGGLPWRRVIVVGPSCSGKSTLGAALAERLGTPFVELDALFWKPGWQQSEEMEFREKLISAHSGERWVSAGNYLRHTRDVTWPRAEAIIWLDFPLWRTTPRILARSWRRWRQKELLWGTNYERFWDQLRLWNPEKSLIAYSASRYRRNHRAFAGLMAECASDGRAFLRLRSPTEVEHLLDTLATPEE